MSQDANDPAEAGPQTPCSRTTLYTPIPMVTDAADGNALACLAAHGTGDESAEPFGAPLIGSRG
jgi:hypothetical protein